MIEEGRPCVDLAQQLHAVESAISNAKGEMVQDYMEHCVGGGIEAGIVNTKTALNEFRALGQSPL